MTRTSSKAALLHIALEDLYAGKLAAQERLPAIARHARDTGLRSTLTIEIARVKEQARRIEAEAGRLAGPRNLWMAGILDDAERDTRSHEAGTVLDIALVGAIRKAKAAEIVSSETAVALAQATGQEAIAAMLVRNRADEIATDRALADCLFSLA